MVKEWQLWRRGRSGTTTAAEPPGPPAPSAAIPASKVIGITRLGEGELGADDRRRIRHALRDHRPGRIGPLGGRTRVPGVLAGQRDGRRGDALDLVPDERLRLNR